MFGLIKKNNFEDKLLKKYGNCTKLKHFNLKILFIADTHDCLLYDKESLDTIKNAKDYNCCILLGDHSKADLIEILKIIPKEKIYGVLGNHDSWEKYNELSITDINKKVIDINGVKIAGISGSFNYKNSKDYALYSHEESTEIAQKMDSADILLTHDKPFTTDNHNPAHDGLKGITEYIYKNHISLHIHGHLHEEQEIFLKNGTKSICLYKVKLLDI